MFHGRSGVKERGQASGAVLGEGAMEAVDGQLMKDFIGHGFYCKSPGNWLEGFM